MVCVKLHTHHPIKAPGFHCFFSVLKSNMKFFVLLLAVGVVASKPTDQESVRIRISQKGLDFGEDVANYMIDLVQKQALDKLKLPKVASGSFEVTNMRFGALNLGKPEISIVPGTGIKWRNPKAQVRVYGDWAIQTLWWNYGSLTLDANLDVTAVAGIKASGGKLSTNSAQCGVHFNSFNLNLHNAFFTWIASLMEGSITPEIRKAVCKELNKLLDTTLNGVIKGLPHEIAVSDIFDVEIEADSNPEFKAKHFDVSARVKADSQNGDATFPFTPEPIVDAVEPSGMACLLISDYTLNTASYLALSAGKVKESVPNAQIPATNPIMNTAFFKTSVPAFYAAYPDAAIVYSVKNTRYPEVEFDKDLVIAGMPVEITISVGTATVATVATDLTVKGTVAQANNVISGSITSAAHTSSVISSQVDGITVATLQAAIDEVLDKAVVPEVNKVFQSGITLPTDKYFTLNSGLLQSQNDFLKICADITLTDYTLAELKKVAENLLG